MRITSPAFQHNGKMPDRFGGANENVNPPLKFEEVPENAGTLALVMDDPDAEPVVGHPFDHWILYNIPSNVSMIGEDSVPSEALQGENDAGQNRYYGPKPPDQEHTYVFKLYALDEELELEEGASKKDLEQAMEGHVIEEAALKGNFPPEQY